MSKLVLEELLSELKSKASELLGEVMIFELAQYTQLFLYQHNKPGIKSFYEEMLNRQRQIEQQMREAKQAEAMKQREIILSEIQRRQENLKSDSEMKNKRSNTENLKDSPSSRRNYFGNRKHAYSNSEPEEDNCSCSHKTTQILEFAYNGLRQIQRGQCIAHSHDGKVTHYNGLDVETGELFAIGEWNICSTNSDNMQIQRQISGIEQELNYLAKLKHINLCHYINTKHQLKEDRTTVYILQEFVVGLNCCFFLNNKLPVDIDMLIHISRGVLCALEFLHRNNVVHKDITESSVYITSKGVVKLANFSIYRRLSDLVMQMQFVNNYNKKTDIYNFGMLMMSLIQGTSHATVNIPLHVNSHLYDFLSKCLTNDEKERFTAAQLLNHPFICVPLERSSPQFQIDVTQNVKSNYSELQAIDFPVVSQSNNIGQSRVHSEFEVLQWIGKGAFGDVLKVRNKLDGGHYAIKRIELNPKNKQLNRKITREVKLLSKLNHENVVRYYNAWIESAIIENTDKESSNANSFNVIPQVIHQKELTCHNKIELLAPPIKDVEWSISYEGKSKPGIVNDSSSDDESDDNYEWGVMLNVDSSDSDSIEFADDSFSSMSDIKETILTVKKDGDINCYINNIREIQFLYIQMEFCDKSTLRTAIDAGLYSDIDRIWRLFREIVEGLAHIHQQGMIHRDLKPVNIFLDLNDHVKIGDFGLATTNILNKPGDLVLKSNLIEENDKEAWSHDGAGDGSLTGQVGTALYTAPELGSTTKTVYNQKVDIYSLGIILFEMCYIPLNTQMERMKVLNGIRAKDIVLPINFTDRGYHKQESLIRLLLNHDVTKRPTSQELLQSSLVPQTVLEEEKLRNMFRHTLNNPQLKAYKYLIASCFQQPVTLAQDVTYEYDDLSMSISNLTNSLPTVDHVKQIITKIFKLHGAQKFSPPLLMPRSKYYDTVDSCVKLMTHSGSIISIPHDLRVPFARYVAWNDITLLRRYSIERVYREKKRFGFHPRELYECAFDIVTPTIGNFMADSEVLYTVNQVINSLPELKNKNVLICLNHTSLVSGILLHCGVKESHIELFKVLSNVKEGKIAKFEMKECLSNLGLSDNCIETFVYLMAMENSLAKIVDALKMITKKKSTEASVLVAQGLDDLKIIIENAEALGVSFPIIVTPGLVYNIAQYSGMICQFVCQLKKKRKRGIMDVLAAGGRYDNMIASYRTIKEAANPLNKDISQTAVGISISLDKLVQAIQKEGEPKTGNLGNLDAVVCSVGAKTQIKEKSRILKDLWSAGISCSLIEAINVEEIQEQCIELNVPHIIMLKDTEHGTVRIRSWERDRFQEKSVNLPDLVDTMQRVKKQWNEGSQELNLISSNTRFEKLPNNLEHMSEATVLIFFVTLEKISANTRRRYENQIKLQLESVFKRLSGDVTVLGLNIESDVIRTLISYLEFESEDRYQKSVEIILERHQRQKKYLIEICDEIYQQKSKRTNPIVVLYNILDCFYKIIF